MSKKKIFLLLLFFTIFFANSKNPRNFFEKVIPEEKRNLLVSGQESNTSEDRSEFFIVKRVVDGDTIELSDGRKLRYIGINAPESVASASFVECFGKEAYEKNRELVEGREIRLEKDVSEIDKYGRLLRYVYITNSSGEEIFVNEYLVEKGYAHSSSYPPDIIFQEVLNDAEKRARENSEGFWNTCK